MIISSSMKSLPPQPATNTLEAVPDQAGSIYAGRTQTKAKQYVSPELSKQVATVYRCANGISDDIASMPLKQFRRSNERTEGISPDAIIRNISYLVEVSSNRWMTPFMLKKTAINWLLFWGNALIWLPTPPAERELFILPVNMTLPKLDPQGNLWYEVRFPNGDKKHIPAVEVLHLMINSTNGMWGRSVLEYARETIGLRLGMSQTQSEIQGNGLNPSAYIQVSASLDKPGRQIYKDAYTEALSDTGGLVVFDNKVTKFEPITMKLTDAQFLESIGATDQQIANFFKYPAYKLGMGKESYQSNEQQDLDYLRSTLDPYLVQWEQAARLRWLSEAEQAEQYFKFNRASILRTDAKTRAELNEVLIRSGQLNPNDARSLEDRDSYPGGDKYWMTSNNAEIGAVAVETGAGV
jgi:HK97 family phage portal protein